ncbi:MAG: PIN domain-containing protein, partial [Deltaproteobacteria bacterium]|nr:PIN domain-containing protein [Deltaproteobacteria bacterium]
MVLIDTSIWIHYFNRSNGAAFQEVGELIRQDQVVTCGPVITEVFSGARNQKDAKLLREQFKLLPFLELEQKDFYEAGDLRAKLQGRGYVVKTVDALIAHLALREGVE